MSNHFYSNSFITPNFHFHTTLIATISVQLDFDSYLKYTKTFVIGLSTVEFTLPIYALPCKKKDICKIQLWQYFYMVEKLLRLSLNVSKIASWVFHNPSLLRPYNLSLTLSVAAILNDFSSLTVLCLSYLPAYQITLLPLGSLSNLFSSLSPDHSLGFIFEWLPTGNLGWCPHGKAEPVVSPTAGSPSTPLLTPVLDNITLYCNCLCGSLSFTF